MRTIRFGFEGGWYAVQAGGTGYLPGGWFPYGDPSRTCEYGHPDENDPHKEHLVRSGEKSLGYDKVWDTHEGGAGRFVPDVEVDSLVTFAMHGRYIFHTIGDDPNVVTVAPVHMRIGIDVVGSDQPGLNTVWSPEQEIAVRDWKNPIVWYPFEVKARARASIVTLFLYTNPTLRGYRGNGPVWDDGIVTITEADECWGQPRFQYKRVYNVVSSVEQAHKVLDLVGLQTIGPSSDDAGMGMLEDKTAVEWNRENTQEYRDFYAEHYPRAKPEFRSTEPEEPGLTLYSQRDPRWRDIVYGGGRTFGQTGCLVTCVAMLTGDEPPDCAQKLTDAGVMEGAYLSRPELVTDAYPDLSYGGTVNWRNTAADLGRLGQWLETGPVVIETEFAPGGATPPEDQHFVVALELDGGDLIIADPWTGERVRLLERYALSNWDLARAIYGVRLFGHEAAEPPPPPPPPLSRNLLGVHQQKEAGGVLEYYAATQPSVYKTVLNFQFIQAIKEVSPETITIIRPFPNDIRGKSAVESILRGIKDDLAVLHPYIDYVELINEQVPSNNQDAIKLAVDTEIWGMEYLKALGYPVKPLILNVAVGNPWGPWDPFNEQELLVPAVEASIAMFGEACIGYHGYWPSNLSGCWLRFGDVNGVRKDVGKYYAFRAQEWDRHTFAPRGLKPLYIATEMGPIGTHGPRPEDGYIDLMSHSGWHSKSCLGGSRSRLIDELALWQAEWAEWNATHGNYFLGGNVFTTPGVDPWDSFDFGEREMEAWTERLG